MKKKKTWECPDCGVTLRKVSKEKRSPTIPEDVLFECPNCGYMGFRKAR